MVKRTTEQELADAVQQIADRMPSEETLRTDHPLMGQTFDDIVQAILEHGKSVSSGLDNVADAIRELAKAWGQP